MMKNSTLARIGNSANGSFGSLIRNSAKKDHGFFDLVQRVSVEGEPRSI